MKELDIYELTISDVDFDAMTAISIVDRPAIEENFILLSKNDKNNFNFSKVEKNTITGPALIPDKKIYRFDWFNGEYFVFFSEKTIQDIANQFIRNNKDNVTIEHMFNANNIYLSESWIINDPKNDKANSLGFNDLPKGTWMVSYKVENEKILEDIQKGEYKGFSIEAFVTQNLFKKADDEKVIKEIEEILNDNTLNDTEKYDKIDTIINSFDF